MTQHLDLQKSLLEAGIWILSEPSGVLGLISFGACCSGPLDLAPRLHQIPRELAPFRDLFSRLGVQDSFSHEQLAGVLADLAATFPAAPLPTKELDQALATVQVPLISALKIQFRA